MVKRHAALVEWTGSELVVWGGGNYHQGSGSLDDGAVFDLAKGSWRRIAKAPIPARSNTAAVWTGRETVIMGGVADDTAAPLDGVAAFDPTTSSWRKISPAPSTPLVGSDHPMARNARWAPVAVWTGSEVLLVGGLAGDGSALADGVAYTPGR